MGMECEVFMGAEDWNAKRSTYIAWNCCAKVHPVTTGTQHIERCCIRSHARMDKSYVRYTLCVGIRWGLIHSLIVRDFQSIISREAREQILEAEGNSNSCYGLCWWRLQCHGNVL